MRRNPGLATQPSPFQCVYLLLLFIAQCSVPARVRPAITPTKQRWKIGRSTDPDTCQHQASDLGFTNSTDTGFQFLIGGQLHVLAGADHLLVEAADEVRERLLAWIPGCFEPAA